VVEVIYPKFGELYEANFIDNRLLDYLEAKEIITAHKLTSSGLKLVDLSNYCGYLGRDFKKLVIPRKLLPVLGVSEKDSPEKIAEAFNSFFDRFFHWVLERLVELPLFTLNVASYDAVEDFGRERDVYKFFLLLNLKEELTQAIEVILHRPHRVLDVEEVLKPVSEVCEVDGVILEEALCHPERWVKSEGKYLPTELIQPQYIESFDSPENRFVRAFLVEILDFIENWNESLRSLLLEVEDIVSFALNSDIFVDLDLQPSPPAYSQVLQKRPGYRELFRLWSLFHSSFIPQWFQGLNIAFGLKSVSTLWEYYVLIRLLDVLKAEFGPYEVVSFKEIKKSRGESYEEITFEFADGAKFYYQLERKSYSKSPWRPDFLLEFNGQRIIFDAKFRNISNESNRREILQNMHYYRDGLQVNWAVALTFGEGCHCQGQLYFYGEKNECVQTLEELLARLRDKDGVGYLKLVPKEVVYG